MIIKALRIGLGQLIIFLDWISRPAKLKRTAEAQAAVEQSARNLALYFSDTSWWRGGEDNGRGFKGLLQQIRERTDGTDHNKYLWMNAAYALGTKVTDAFAKYGWTTAIRGVEGGGKVESMTAHTFRTDEGDIALKCPTEVTITDRREKELNDLGFIAIVNSKGSNFAAFFGGQTVNKPKLYNKDNANANAQLSSRLPYMLAASRFAHYVKVIIRDKIGSFQTKASIEAYLNNWISDYICLNDAAPQATKARLPLGNARIDVTEVAGKPGVYQAIVFVRPHFQMEELTASIRMVAELPAAAA